MTDRELTHICATTLDAKLPRMSLGEVVDMPVDSCAFCKIGECVQSLAGDVVLHMRSQSSPRRTPTECTCSPSNACPRHPIPHPTPEVEALAETVCVGSVHGEKGAIPCNCKAIVQALTDYRAGGVKEERKVSDAGAEIGQLVAADLEDALDELASKAAEACPCLHTTPCDPRCTCVEPLSSTGCSRCCSYGRKAQQIIAAEHLAALPVLDSQALERTITEASNALFDVCGEDYEHIIACHADTLPEMYRAQAVASDKALQILQEVVHAILDRNHVPGDDPHKKEMQMGETTTQLPLYRCHKEVRAAKITGLGEINPAQEGRVRLILGDVPTTVEVSGEWLAKHSFVEVGGYYVVYEDGYASYSPAKAFEDGYDPIAE